MRTYTNTGGGKNGGYMSYRSDMDSESNGNYQRESGGGGNY